MNMDTPTLDEAARVLGLCAAEGDTYAGAVLAALGSRGAAIERVRQLHSPDKYGDCPACRLSFDGEAEPWPCPTIRALDAGS